ncbi:MAG TPA: hypothetical protein PKD86_01180 [Gemmatales bacterium]|nr:hypothetical protein [Gemmatales bacterium]HMP57937.1 hypothetical protein [Gemmatales bacterium]
MSRALGFAALALLAAFGVHSASSGQAQAPQDEASALRLVVTGKVAGAVLLQGASGAQVRKVLVVMLELGDKPWLGVALPTFPPRPGGQVQGDDETRLRDLNTRKPTLAVTGRLTTSNNHHVLNAVGVVGKDAISFMVGDQVVEVSEANEKRFPPTTWARVDGRLTRGNLRVGSFATDWSLQGIGSDIVPLKRLPGVGSFSHGVRARVSGPMVWASEQVVLEAKEVETLE